MEGSSFTCEDKLSCVLCAPLACAADPCSRKLSAGAAAVVDLREIDRSGVTSGRLVGADALDSVIDAVPDFFTESASVCRDGGWTEDGLDRSDTILAAFASMAFAFKPPVDGGRSPEAPDFGFALVLFLGSLAPGGCDEGTAGGTDGRRLGAAGGVESRRAWIGRGGFGGLDGESPLGRGTTIPIKVGLLEVNPPTPEVDRGGGTLLERAEGALEGRGGGVEPARAPDGGVDQLSPGRRGAVFVEGLGADGTRVSFRAGAPGRDDKPPPDLPGAVGTLPGAPGAAAGVDARLRRVSTLPP